MGVTCALSCCTVLVYHSLITQILSSAYCSPSITSLASLVFEPISLYVLTIHTSVFLTAAQPTKTAALTAEGACVAGGLAPGDGSSWRATSANHCTL